MKRLLVLIPLALIGTAQAKDKDKASAELKDAKGEKIGTATITPNKDGGVKIKLEVAKLSPGKHAFHIHAAGKCEGPEFKSAGGHFNPGNKKHGLQNPEGPHGGDMPDVEVGADGKGKTEVVNANVTLGAGANSLFGAEGTAIVVHEKEDDNKSDPAGNAGARIACGVIK